ncbi:hypothetical protein ADUPG1_006600, partial [Aduncisulcus paluster]
MPIKNKGGSDEEAALYSYTAPFLISKTHKSPNPSKKSSKPLTPKLLASLHAETSSKYKEKQFLTPKTRSRKPSLGLPKKSSLSLLGLIKEYQKKTQSESNDTLQIEDSSKPVESLSPLDLHEKRRERGPSVVITKLPARSSAEITCSPVTNRFQSLSQYNNDHGESKPHNPVSAGKISYPNVKSIVGTSIQEAIKKEKSRQKTMKTSTSDGLIPSLPEKFKSELQLPIGSIPYNSSRKGSHVHSPIHQTSTDIFNDFTPSFSSFEKKRYLNRLGSLSRPASSTGQRLASPSSTLSHPPHDEEHSPATIPKPLAADLSPERKILPFKPSSLLLILISPPPPTTAYFYAHWCELVDTGKEKGCIRECWLRVQISDRHKVFKSNIERVGWYLKKHKKDLIERERQKTNQKRVQGLVGVVVRGAESGWTRWTEKEKRGESEDLKVEPMSLIKLERKDLPQEYIRSRPKSVQRVLKHKTKTPIMAHSLSSGIGPKDARLRKMKSRLLSHS